MKKQNKPTLQSVRNEWKVTKGFSENNNKNKTKLKVLSIGNYSEQNLQETSVKHKN